MDEPLPLPRRAAYPLLEAAQLLGISRNHLYKLIEDGVIRRVKLGGRALIPADEIQRVIAAEPDDV